MKTYEVDGYDTIDHRYDDKDDDDYHYYFYYLETNVKRNAERKEAKYSTLVKNLRK